MTTHAHDGLPFVEAAGPGIVVVAALAFWTALYVGAAWRRRRTRPWPMRRVAAWIAGSVVVALATTGPLAARVHEDAVAHMVAHLAVGMVAPLLLVLAAPTTLALRTLEVGQARRLTRILRSRLVRIVSHPFVTTASHVGTMWALYGTAAGRDALHDPLLHVLVLVHLLVTGVLFTWSLVGIDPAPHRPRLAVRATALVLAAAAHRILAVRLYADADLGASVAEAQTAARVMSTGGDLVELSLALVLFAQWYARSARASRGRSSRLAVGAPRRLPRRRPTSAAS